MACRSWSLSSSPDATRLRNRRSTSPSVTRAPSRSASSRAAPPARTRPRSRASSVIHAARAVGRGAIAEAIVPPAAFMGSARRRMPGPFAFDFAASTTARPWPGAMRPIVSTTRSRVSLRLTSTPGFATTASVPPPNIAGVARRSWSRATSIAADVASARRSHRSSGEPTSLSSLVANRVTSRSASSSSSPQT